MRQAILEMVAEENVRQYPVEVFRVSVSGLTRGTAFENAVEAMSGNFYSYFRKTPQVVCGPRNWDLTLDCEVLHTDSLIPSHSYELNLAGLVALFGYCKGGLLDAADRTMNTEAGSVSAFLVLRQDEWRQIEELRTVNPQWTGDVCAALRKIAQQGYFTYLRGTPHVDAWTAGTLREVASA